MTGASVDRPDDDEPSRRINDAPQADRRSVVWDPPATIETVEQSEGCLKWSWPLAVAVCVVALVWGIVRIVDVRVEGDIEREIVDVCSTRLVVEIGDCVRAYLEGFEL